MKKTLISTSSKTIKKHLLSLAKKQIDTLDLTHKTSISIDLDTFAEEELKNIPDIRIDITLLAWLKMTLLVKNSAKEIAWHGLVTRLSQNNFVISDAFTYPQIVTAATVDADENQYSSWILGRIEQINNIRMQGHSHVSMGVSPSGTDIDYYKKLVNQVDDFYIFLILNKSGEYHVRVYDKVRNILFTDVKINFLELDSGTWIREQMLMIQEKTYQTPIAAYQTPSYAQPPKPVNEALKTAMTEEDVETAYEMYRYEGKLKGRYD
jgi:hypothetical protein